MSIQTTINFPSKKKCNFYGVKSETPKVDFSNATLRETPSCTRYVSKVKKLLTLSSSESESDSDTENFDKSPKKAGLELIKSPRRTRKLSNSDDKSEVSPSKQKKLQTPDTPSTLLTRLNLESSPGRLLQPKKLFEIGKYQNARKALHSSAPDNLPGRETELAELEGFLKQHLDSKASGSLYVSGPPGTGKTASLSKIILQPEFKSAFRTVYVNCTAMKSAAAIYSKIVEELNISTGKSTKNAKGLIEKYLVSSHKMVLLVLDEIDQLESKRQTVLYSIFEWPSIPKSKILLIGIANALDLTDRILPRLQAKCILKPKLMHFAPYSKQQIVSIISERLKEANVSELFTATAIQLLAGKVAAVSGDIRRALDISRRVIELAEAQKSTQILQPAVDNAKNVGSPKKAAAVVIDKPADIKEVVSVLNGVYGGSQNIEEDEDTFPLQQKLLICSLMLILNKGRNKDITVSRLHEVYRKVCKKRNIHSVDTSEFVGICSLIESRGVIKLVGKKEPKFTKISLQWDQEELEEALKDKNLMAEIIDDSSCL